MKKCRFGAAVLACLLVLTMVFDMIPVSVEAASSSEIKNQITEMEEENEELKKQIKELKSKYKKNENEIKDIVAQKDLIDQEISLLTAQIANINRQITAFGLLIADKQDELDMARDHLAELNEKNKERIRAMEEEGGLSYWTVLFQANSFSDLLDRINMVQEIASSDQRRLKELQKAAPAPGVITESWLLPILRTMLSTLEYLHSKNIYHRDVKPANILLTEDGSPVLIDFGLARETESGPTSLLAAFTPGYSPLEQNIRAIHTAPQICPQAHGLCAVALISPFEHIRVNANLSQCILQGGQLCKCVCHLNILFSIHHS